MDSGFMGTAASNLLLGNVSYTHDLTKTTAVGDFGDLYRWLFDGEQPDRQSRGYRDHAL